MCGGGGASGHCCRREFWAYRSRIDDEDMDLHVACMKEMACLSWDAESQVRVGGGQIVLARAPASMDHVLQALPRKMWRSSRFQRFWKIVGAVMNVVIAVIFGNPVVMVAAIAGPGGLLRS
ncbi:hypothetical protein BAE44_0019230 [Dichanthelium oligosanthes]|uniref:Uncharacterized protein n=1 Tax=Dichanthelium oligosanthes TaxID=888268 RepID=A0A1E5V3M6_9POAL|nr:hypothetical protein BAE44_0019230 [Dichanthelium oligosanthes]